MVRKGYFILLLVVLFFVTGCVTEKDEPVWSLSAGDSLPQFSVRMNDGSLVATETLRGRVSMIVFFNTGCGDCREELPRIQEVFDMCIKEGLPVDIICISRGEGQASVEKYWAENKLSLPYSAQDDKSVYQLFATSIIPRIYISSPDLKIKSVYTDYPLPSSQTLLDALHAEINEVNK